MTGQRKRVVSKTPSTLVLSNGDKEERLERQLKQVIFESVLLSVHEDYSYESTCNGKPDTGRFPPFDDAVKSGEEELIFLAAKVKVDKAVSADVIPDNYLHAFNATEVVGAVSSAELRFYIREDHTVAVARIFELDGQLMFHAQIGMLEAEFSNLFRETTQPISRLHVTLHLQVYSHRNWWDDEPQDYFMQLDKGSTAIIGGVHAVRETKTRPFKPTKPTTY